MLAAGCRCTSSDQLSSGCRELTPHCPAPHLPVVPDQAAALLHELHHLQMVHADGFLAGSQQQHTDSSIGNHIQQQSKKQRELLIGHAAQRTAQHAESVLIHGLLLLQTALLSQLLSPHESYAAILQVRPCTSA